MWSGWEEQLGVSGSSGAEWSGAESEMEWTRVPQRWWEQKGLEMKEARERATEAEAAAETEGTAADGRAAVTAAQAVEPATTPETVQGAEMWSGWEEQLGVSGSSGAEWSGAESE